LKYKLFSHIGPTLKKFEVGTTKYKLVAYTVQLQLDYFSTFCEMRITLISIVSITFC